MTNIYLIKTKLCLIFIIIPILASGQNDTTVYYSRSYSVVNSIDEAGSFQTFLKKSAMDSLSTMS